HSQVYFSPTEGFHYAGHYPTAPTHNQNLGANWAANRNDLYLVLGLPQDKIEYLRGYFMNPLKDIPQRVTGNNVGNGGGCMWWLVDARIAPNYPLAWQFGVHQSFAPSNLYKKLIHAGTDDVVVGIPM